MYKFYFQQVNKDENLIEGTKKSLEDDYAGLSYLSFKGLENRGKTKNVYTETYAEKDGVRVYHPTDEATPKPVTHEATKVTLDIVIQGENRRAVYKELCDYLSSSRLKYWDTARHKLALLVLEDAIEPTDDTLRGIEYIRCAFNFTNVWGVTKTCDDDGLVE